MAEDILNALLTLHQVGYAQGDIKLENVVFVSQVKRYKLVDMDNAKPFSHCARHLGTQRDQKARLLRCLHINPLQRGSLLDFVSLLPNPSTRTLMTNMYNEIKDMNHHQQMILMISYAMLAQVADSKQSRLRVIFSYGTEVTVPTSFVLAPFNIQNHQSKPHAQKQSNLPSKLQMEQAKGFFRRLKEVGTNIVPAVQTGNPLAAAKAALDAFTLGEPLYFYLVDEVTGVPVDNGGAYPIEITTRTDKYVKFIATNMALFQRGFQFLKLANTAAGFFKSLGIPTVTDDVLTDNEGILFDDFAADFTAIENALGKTAERGRNTQTTAVQQNPSWFPMTRPYSPLGTVSPTAVMHHLSEEQHPHVKPHDLAQIEAWLLGFEQEAQSFTSYFLFCELKFQQSAVLATGRDIPNHKSTVDELLVRLEQRVKELEAENADLRSSLASGSYGGSSSSTTTQAVSAFTKLALSNDFNPAANMEKREKMGYILKTFKALQGNEQMQVLLSQMELLGANAEVLFNMIHALPSLERNTLLDRLVQDKVQVMRSYVYEMESFLKGTIEALASLVEALAQEKEKVKRYEARVFGMTVIHAKNEALAKGNWIDKCQELQAKLDAAEADRSQLSQQLDSIHEKVEAERVERAARVAASEDKQTQVRPDELQKAMMHSDNNNERKLVQPGFTGSKGHKSFIGLYLMIQEANYSVASVKRILAKKRPLSMLELHQVISGFYQTKMSQDIADDNMHRHREDKLIQTVQIVFAHSHVTIKFMQDLCHSQNEHGEVELDVALESIVYYWLKLYAEQIVTMHNVFQLGDKDTNGVLDFAEFSDVVHHLDPDMTRRDCLDLYNHVAGADNVIDKEEFVMGMILHQRDIGLKSYFAADHTLATGSVTTPSTSSSTPNSTTNHSGGATVPVATKRTNVKSAGEGGYHPQLPFNPVRQLTMLVSKFKDGTRAFAEGSSAEPNVNWEDGVDAIVDQFMSHKHLSDEQLTGS
ncbi:hypothetical protein DYB37_007737 [Aphanomyces astaci]|uniref:EF-hand domain-containing protein n=1 Tax=Aphanomyces astaci TaxID=112090 RepID=A0A418F2H5_APHAT|nr:hypothetical protein DYB37_007737 [Aphanomyces astaci]